VPSSNNYIIVIQHLQKTTSLLPILHVGGWVMSCPPPQEYCINDDANATAEEEAASDIDAVVTLGTCGVR